MNKIYTLIPVLFFAFISQAQNPIPNSSFETWTNPAYPNNCSNSTSITKSTTAHTGQFAAKGEMVSGSPEPDLAIGGGNGFAVSGTYTYLNFYYIFNKVGNETMQVVLYLDNDNTGTTVGLVNSTISTASATYVAKSIPISNTGSGATSGMIDFTLFSNNVGSYFIIDDVSLSSTPLAVEDIQKEAVSLHVYPNLATNVVRLSFDNEQGKETTIQVNNMMGQTVLELRTTTNKTSFDVSQLPAGNYVVAVKNEEAILTKQLMIQ